MSPALARASRRLLLAVAPLLVVLEVPGAYELLRRPDPGFKLLHATVMEVEPDSAAEAGGLRVDDRLVAVEGQRVHGYADLLAVLSTRADVDSLAVEVRRDGERVRAVLPLRSGPTGARAYDLLMSFSALCFLFLGFVTYLRRDDALGRTFFLTCVLLAFPFLDLPSVPNAWAMRTLQGIRDATQILMPALLLRFLLMFPEEGAEPAPARRRRRWTLLPALVVAPLHMVSALLVHVQGARRWESLLLLVTVVLFAAYVLAGISVFARKILRSERWTVRTKLRLALLGLVAGVVPLTLATLVRALDPSHTGPLDELAILALPLVPASFSVALLRSGAVDLAYLARQVLIALFLTLPLLLLAWALTGVAGPELSPQHRTVVYVAVLLLVPLASVLVRAPTRTIAGWVDRVLYPEQRRVRAASARLGHRLTEVEGPDALLDLLVNEIEEVVGCERCSIFEPGEGQWRRTHPEDGPEPTLPTRSTLAHELVHNRDLLVVDRLVAGRRRPLDGPSRHWIEATGARVVAPLALGGDTLALLVLGPPRQRKDYTTLHLYHLSTLCREAAIALENARLHAEDLHRERVRTELGLAREIQQRLLPQQPLRRPGLEIHGRTRSCRSVGGDLFDYFDLSDGRLVAVVADTAGKGIPASLLTSGLRTAVRETVRPGLELEKAVAHVNRHVHGMTAQGHFIAMFVAILEPANGMVEYCCAGIEPPVWVRARLGRTELLTQGGAVLGIDPDARYRCGTLRLEADDSLLVYTDGVIDEENAEGEEFGLERLRRAGLAHQRNGAGDTLAAILTQLEHHRAGEAVDDTTLMVLRRSRYDRAGTEDASAWG